MLFAKHNKNWFKTFVAYHVLNISLQDKFNMYTVKQEMILHNYGLMINAVVSEWHFIWTSHELN